MLDSPSVFAGAPDNRHLDRVAELLAATGHGGNLVNDAHLGALALQYDATVVSYDNDFSRFPGVRWERPTQLDELTLFRGERYACVSLWPARLQTE